MKSFINLMKLLFFLVIYLHWYACLWWYINSNEEDDKQILPMYQTDLFTYYKLYDDPCVNT